MMDDVSSKVLEVITGKEVCTLMYRLPSGETERIGFLVSVLQRMNYLQAIGAILDTVDDRTGGISELEKHYLVLYLRDYLMNITL